MRLFWGGLKVSESKQLAFSILMPTYNDEEHLGHAIQSVLNQSWQAWELIVVDDASTDATPAIMTGFADERIKYIRHKENSDQLNALLTGAGLIRGTHVLFLHSDDEFVSPESLATIARTFMDHPATNAVYADLLTMDRNGVRTGRWRAFDGTDQDLLKQLFWGYAGNPVFDPFVVSRAVFDSSLTQSYLKDNTPYYLVPESYPPILALRKVEPWYCYRLHAGNYICSDVGKFVASNGPMRTIKFLYDQGIVLPLWVVSNSLVFRMVRKTGLWKLIPLKRKRDPAAFRAYCQRWHRDLQAQGYPEILLRQLTAMAWSAGRQPKDGVPLVIECLPSRIYDGKDARRFFKDWQAGQLDPLYLELLEPCHSCVVVEDADRADMERIMKFLCLDYTIQSRKDPE